MTGEFTAQGAIDDVSDFEGGQWGGVGHWLDFYKGHAKYQQGAFPGNTSHTIDAYVSSHQPTAAGPVLSPSQC